METFSDIINSEGLVLVDFFATWCQPCRTMHPILEQVKQKVGNRVRIIKVDVDRMGDAAQVYGIQSVPTLMLFRGGNLLWRQSGVVPAAQLAEIIGRFDSR
ncbi:MAG: thioredoxin [Muribaculaceae bacterium]